MSPRKSTEAQIDSQKIRLIPQPIDGIAQLHKLIVTGNLETGEPGLLESVRGIRNDVKEIKDKGQLCGIRKTHQGNRRPTRAHR